MIVRMQVSGAEQTVTALYEIVPVKSGNSSVITSQLLTSVIKIVMRTAAI